LAIHPAALPVQELLRQCDTVRTRRGGPGGQHRNKVETAVVLTHRPTGLTAEAAERRSQAENQRVAVGRLRLRLAIEQRTRPAVAGPSPLWQSRVRGRQISVSPRHEDLPALIAEALDQLEQSGWEMAPTAAALGVTTSQLIKLFRQVPAAWEAINRLRLARGLPSLK